MSFETPSSGALFGAEPLLNSRAEFIPRGEKDLAGEPVVVRLVEQGAEGALEVVDLLFLGHGAVGRAVVAVRQEAADGVLSGEQGGGRVVDAEPAFGHIGVDAEGIGARQFGVVGGGDFALDEFHLIALGAPGFAGGITQVVGDAHGETRY